MQVEENKHKSNIFKFINDVAINRRAWTVDGTENGIWLSRLKVGNLGKWEREGKRCAVCGNITMFDHRFYPHLQATRRCLQTIIPPLFTILFSGINLSLKIIAFLSVRYASRNGHIAFDDFVQIVSRMENLIGKL